MMAGREERGRGRGAGGGVVVVGKTNSKGDFKCASQRAQRHLMVLVPLKVHPSVCRQSHMTRAILVGLYSISHGERAPPRTLKPQCWHFRNYDSQICLEDQDETGLSRVV